MKRRYLIIMLSMLIALSGCNNVEKTVDEKTVEFEETKAAEMQESELQDSNETDNVEEDDEISMEDIKDRAIKINPPKTIDENSVITVGNEDVDFSKIEALSLASVDMFAEAAKADTERNVLIAPTSVIMALGMTQNGACGNTLDQMEEVVGGGLSRDELNSLCKALSNKMNTAKNVDWNNANSIWLKDDGQYTIREGFLSKVTTYYGADVWMAPFDETTVKEVNAWVNEQTRQRIPKMLDSLNSQSRMLLVNAIAFDGEWDEAYKDEDIEEDVSFNNADGSSTNVTMLNSKEASYFEYGNATGFIRPYKGYEYSFVGILPDESTDIEEYVAWLSENGEGFAGAVNNAENADVYVTMPEFKTEYGILEMKKQLINMGMADAFDENKADFSDMLDSVSGEDFRLWIGSVLHKACIDVNRKGTSAAAATVVDMRCYATAYMEKESVYITLDRPFIYAIVDNETGLPIFMGCMKNMD